MYPQCTSLHFTIMHVVFRYFQVTVSSAWTLMSARLELITATMMQLVRTMLDPIPVNVTPVTKVQ